MATNEQKHILIAPLDWGLGHTTRVMPLISHIQSLGHIPIVAGNATQRSFIKETFSKIENIHLDGYDITYSKWNKWAQAGILAQLPHIQRAIAREHVWLKNLTQERKIDGIISDNRYGLFHQHIPSVILTHQLQVRSGLGNFTDRAIQKIHYKYLNRFGATWVVDAQNSLGLAGNLSHTKTLPHHTSYIGLLSRFAPVAGSATGGGPFLVLLSGPEPQRGALSHILWQQVQRYPGNVVFVEGTEQAQPPAGIPAHITWHQRLHGAAAEQAIRNADIIVCRSGYSTLMDLVALQKKAILIPTPGQTEQEYLGHTLHKQGIFYSTQQKGFDLNASLAAAQQFPFHSISLQQHFNDHEQVMEKWLGSL